MGLHYIQASAGSGKTTAIENDVVARLKVGDIQPNQIMAVTFTTAAATELKTRISQKLLKEGLPESAFEFMSSRVGTVHSILGQLLNDYAFELGMSPKQEVIEEADQKKLIYECLENIIHIDELTYFNELAARLCNSNWQESILSVIESIRINRFDSELIKSFINKSIRFLSQHLPKADPSITLDRFYTLLKKAIEDAKQISNPTKGLENAISECERILNSSPLTWENWWKVSKLNPTKIGIPAFEKIKALGADILKCSQFQNDIRDFISQMLNIAEDVIEKYAELKYQRGFIDFIDQEVIALKALDITVIRERLQNEIKYLIVDEFQDTSPIQLAIFSKLSELVDDLLLVGDAKQAIYGFRGSDPQLSLDVLNYTQEGKGTVSTLSNSWRSRAGLVSFINSLFTSPFSHLLKPEQVQLKATSQYQLSLPELGWWNFDDTLKNNPDRLLALALQLYAYVHSGIEIWCKHSKHKKQLTWADIGVLFRSNDEASEFAFYCAKVGIPVSIERSGLIETPEVSLALACLRVLMDPSDSLASAEILSLATGNGAEVWLSNRLDSVANNKSRDWNNEAHPILKNLTELRQNLKHLSVKEALELAVLVSDVNSIVVSWDETMKLAEYRLFNLSKLTGLVDDYERHCKTQYFATTITGFLLWLKDKEQKFTDNQPANPGDAITISTYHGAKGLEWPVVICASLNSQLKVSLFGPRVSTTCKFDWNNPLAGRFLTYCPNPFPNYDSNPFVDLFIPTEEWGNANQQAHNEAIQLLYVGMTRARDQLILINHKESEWLKLLESKYFPLTSESLELSCEERVNVDIKCLALSNETQFSSNQRIDRKRYWFSPISPVNSIVSEPYFTPASLCSPIHNANCEIIYDFSSRIPLSGIEDMKLLGNVMHQCLALLITSPEIDQKLIDNLLKKNFDGKIISTDIIHQTRLFTQWIEQNYPESRLHTEFPFSRYLSNESLQQGSIDLLLETEVGWIIIDHKSNPQPKDKWKEIASSYSGQLNSYKESLIKLSDKPVLSTLIYFSVSGGLVEVKI